MGSTFLSGTSGLIYESDTRRGLYVWNVSAPEVGGAMVHLDYLNPQTNHLSFPAAPKVGGQ